VRRYFLRAGLAALLILLAALVVVVAPSLWAGAGGRDFRPQGTLLAGILLVGGAALRLVSGWPLAVLAGGLLLVEVVALLLIGYFSGLTGWNLLDPFNLRWLAYVNLFIGAPWIAGGALGAAIAASRRRTAGDN